MNKNEEITFNKLKFALIFFEKDEKNLKRVKLK